MIINDGALLFGERDGRRKEPGDLVAEDVRKVVWRASQSGAYLLGRDLELQLHPKNSNVCLACASVKGNDDVPTQALIEHLLLVTAGLMRWPPSGGCYCSGRKICIRYIGHSVGHATVTEGKWLG